MSYCYVTGTYNQYPSHYGPPGQYLQSFSSSANFEQDGNSIQNSPPAPIDPLNWDYDIFTPSFGSVAQVSTIVPIQTNSSSAVPLLPHSYFDIVASSRALPVAAPVPVPHAALTKAALRNMMLFDDKGNIYRIPFDKEAELTWTLSLRQRKLHLY